jgi:hypothetical protein
VPKITKHLRCANNEDFVSPPFRMSKTGGGYYELVWGQLTGATLAGTQVFAVELVQDAEGWISGVVSHDEMELLEPQLLRYDVIADLEGSKNCLLDGSLTLTQGVGQFPDG